MTTTTRQQIESHDIHTDRLLRHAEQMLDRRDRLQASEKIWGAAAHMLKGIAKRRGWPNTSHTDGIVIAGYIADKVQEPSIRERFDVAAQTHQNFYEDRLSIPELRARYESVKLLTRQLRDADQKMPKGLVAPSDTYYRRRHSRSFPKARRRKAIAPREQRDQGSSPRERGSGPH